MAHQDLKPENIMIDSNGTLKIIYFGSTKIAGVQEITNTVERNQLLEKIHFAAPEFFTGNLGSHQSVIYAIACITYELVCRKLPYGKPLSERYIKNATYNSMRISNENIPAWVDAAIEKE